jgi:hypothetical protein
MTPEFFTEYQCLSKIVRESRAALRIVNLFFMPCELNATVNYRRNHLAGSSEPVPIFGPVRLTRIGALPCIQIPPSQLLCQIQIPAFLPAQT